MADSCIAFVGKEYVIMAADTTYAPSIVTQLTDMDKILVLDAEKLLNCVELDSGDRANFLEYVQKNMHLHEYRTGRKLTLSAASSWIRRQLAEYLRSRTPFRVNLLLGGVEGDGVPSLYYLDYLASCCKLEYAAQGYCGYMAPAVLDRYWKPNMTQAEGFELMHKVIDQIRKRLAVVQPKFVVKIITKEGVAVSYH